MRATNKKEEQIKYPKEQPKKNESSTQLGYLRGSVASKKILDNFNIEDYEIVKQIGQGSNGKIYMVKDKQNKKYAMKKLIAHDSMELYSLKHEFELLHTIDHENVIKIYGIAQNKLDFTTYGLYIIMDIAEKDWDGEIKERFKKFTSFGEEYLNQ